MKKRRLVLLIEIVETTTITITSQGEITNAPFQQSISQELPTEKDQPLAPTDDPLPTDAAQYLSSEGG